MAAVLLWLKPLAAAAWRVLKVAVPVPLFVILAIWTWAHFDKASAVRQAVDRAVTDLVAGAQLDSLTTQLIEERRLRAFVEGKAAALAAANQAFEDKFILAELQKEGLADELEEVRAAPAPDGCVVDRPLLERLSR